jgi:anthranilate 1,2-dioxygenase small subunit
MSQPIAAEVRTAIEYLIFDAARLIDEDKLEEWVGLFAPQCRYRVTTRENFDQGLPIALIDCDSLGMIKDRVLSYREANIYNPHLDRHVIGNVRVLGERNGAYEVYSSYAAYQTNPDGESVLFSVGKYLDRIVFVAGEARFEERIVVADTWAIRNLLATPL